MQEAEIKAAVDAEATISFGSNTPAEISVVRDWLLEGVNSKINVPLAELQVYLEIDGPGTIEAVIAQAAGDPDADPVVAPDAACQKVLKILDPSQFRRESIDVSDANVLGILNALVANAAIPTFTSADITAIQAMGTPTTTPRWQALGLNRPPRFADVKRAGELP